MIELGMEVKCKVSGFTGVAIGRTTWLNGCVRITVQPKIKADGTMAATECIDEPQLDVVGGIAKIIPNEAPITGGPLSSVPTREPDPRR